MQIQIKRYVFFRYASTNCVLDAKRLFSWVHLVAAYLKIKLKISFLFLEFFKFLQLLQLIQIKICVFFLDM